VPEQLQVTVVVPTRDRPDALARCLAALERQTFEAFEVVVVDDRSHRRDDVQAVVARMPRARVVDGEGRGPAAARNLGARTARGVTVCFTDDDCVPGPEWVGALAARVDAARAVVAGPTRPGGRSPFVRASQIVTNHLVDESVGVDGSVGFAPTSNIACRRDVHDAVPFDEHFPTAAGEDRAWCDALRAAGHRIGFAPAAWVVPHPDRDARRVWRQHPRYGAGAFSNFRSSSAGAGRQPVRFYRDLVRRGVGDGVAIGVLVLVAQVATATGFATEAYRARRAG
jgi:glycosyltransferase involved in cell wall biosynthesis